MKQIGGEDQMWTSIMDDLLRASQNIGVGRGYRYGIEVLIRDNFESGSSRETVIKKLQKYYNLNYEEALEFVREYEVKNTK